MFLVLPYDVDPDIFSKVSASTKVPSLSPMRSSPPPDHRDTSTGISEDVAKRRAMERATKRFQVVTKEEDWRVAKAYVALGASSPSSSSSSSPLPDKESKEWFRRSNDEKPFSSVLSGRALKEEDDLTPSSAASLRVNATARAVDAYLDDDEWEAKQRARGKGPASRLSFSSSSMNTCAGGGKKGGGWLSPWKFEKSYF